MPDKSWKRTERMHAERHGAFKTARLGPYHGTNYPDWISDLLAGESKHSESVPQWIKDAVQQSIDNERKFFSVDGKYRLPVVVLHSSGDLFDEDIVLIRDSFFRGVVMSALAAFLEVQRLSWKENQT